MSRHLPRTPRLRWILALAVAASLTGGTAVAKLSSGMLQSNIGRAKAHEQSLQAGINADNAHIANFQPRLSSLQARLAALERSLGIERGLLNNLQTQLRGAQGHLAVLKARLASGQKLLAAQLVADYEGDVPDGLSVIINAHGFSDLLEKVDQLKAIAHLNAQSIVHIGNAKAAVDGQVAHLTDLEGRQARITAAVLSQRDQVIRLRLAVLAQERPFAQARAARSAQLNSIRSRRQALERQLSVIQQQEAKAQARAFGFNVSGGAPSGNDGFFPAPGTNYSVGSEPVLAARLNALGKALHLHLIGISGYRTPQHSVEVGGFANDPHTRGEASDTPGVEGVPESVLNRFGLTRPFGGAAEADHIQLH